jgi:hypothetical protein
MSSLQQLILETLHCRVLNEDKNKVTIHKDTLVADVHGGVNIGNKNLTKIPVKFGAVGGSFDCSDNELTSLEGAPQTVEGYFYCYNNQLTSLEGTPQTVGRGFYCSNNQLTSLHGAPQRVGGSFKCSDQKSGKKFTEDEVKEVSNVKGSIYV